MRYYYIPLCTKNFTFENIFSSESISPLSFYAKRGFGIDYFYSIPEYHHESALILFNQPPCFDIDSANTQDLKYILAISETGIDEQEIISVDEGIVAYTKSINLNRKNCKVFFFSERDQTITLLKAEISLPTKGLNKYHNNFQLITEQECKTFDITNIKKLKISIDHEEKEILFDQKYNYFKGYVYGIATGIVNQQPVEQIQLRRRFQEIINLFAEIRNRLDNQMPTRGSKYQRPSSFYQNTTALPENNLRSIVNATKIEFNNLFPGESFSEGKLVQFIYNKFKPRLKSLEAAQEYLDKKIIDDQILGSVNFDKIKSYYFKHSRDKQPILYFDMIEQQLQSFMNTTKSNAEWAKANRNNIYDQFKEVMFELSTFIEASFLEKTTVRNVSLDAIHLNSIKMEVDIGDGFQALPDKSLKEFTVITNIILQHPKVGRGEAKKEEILEIVGLVGNAFSKNRSTQLYQYLNNEIHEYSIDKASSVVMKNFVAFVFNPDSIEKLESFLEAKIIDESWMAYGFWCAFNGFANTSRNFVKPVFETTNHLLQDYLDNYLLSTFNGDKTANYGIDILPLQNLILNEPPTLSEKNKEFYYQFIDGKYNLTLSQFETVVAGKSKDDIVNDLKEKYKIKKIDGKKIVTGYLELVGSSTLF
jgi:hypothetical protein